jgi:hypothetical protein
MSNPDGELISFWDEYSNTWRAPIGAYDHVGGRAGNGSLINSAEAPQRNRPVIREGSNGIKSVRQEQIKLESLYVGDIVTFVSEAGEFHTGVAVGATYGWLKVMVDNMIFFCEPTKITFLNSAFVIAA